MMMMHQCIMTHWPCHTHHAPRTQGKVPSDSAEVVRPSKSHLLHRVCAWRGGLTRTGRDAANPAMSMTTPSDCQTRACIEEKNSQFHSPSVSCTKSAHPSEGGGVHKNQIEASLGASPSADAGDSQRYPRQSCLLPIQIGKEVMYLESLGQTLSSIKSNFSRGRLRIASLISQTCAGILGLVR